MRKKVISILLSASMVMTLAVGCGSSEKPKDGGTSDNGSDEEQIELTILSTLITETEAPLEQAMADAYMEQHPNVKITLVGQPVNDMPQSVKYQWRPSGCIFYADRIYVSGI